METPQLPVAHRRPPVPLSDVTQYINPDIHGARAVPWAANGGGGRNSRQDTYKTVICQAWLEHNNCAFGDNCRFAHGEQELRPMGVRNIRNAAKYKTKLCEKYTKTGICPYGNRCLFIHPAPQAGTVYYSTPVAAPQPLMKIPLKQLSSTPLDTGSYCSCSHPQPLTTMDGTPVRHDTPFHHRHQSVFGSWFSDPSALNEFRVMNSISPPNPSPPMPLNVDVGKQRSMSDSVVGANWIGSPSEMLPDAFDAPAKENSCSGAVGYNPFSGVSPFTALNPFATKPSPCSTVSSTTSPYSSIFSLSSGIWSPDNEPAQQDLEPVAFTSNIPYDMTFGAPNVFGSIGSRSLDKDENTPTTLGDLTSALPQQNFNPWEDMVCSNQSQDSNVRDENNENSVEKFENFKL